MFYKKNIRDYGSGNLGATNAYRVLGIKAGVIVAIADILKGTLACLLPLILSSDSDIEQITSFNYHFDAPF